MRRTKTGGYQRQDHQQTQSNTARTGGFVRVPAAHLHLLQNYEYRPHRYLVNWRITGNSAPIGLWKSCRLQRNCICNGACYALAIIKASLFYRTASILLSLFAVGQTLGFRRIEPKLGIDPTHLLVRCDQPASTQADSSALTGTSLLDSDCSSPCSWCLQRSSRGSLVGLHRACSPECAAAHGDSWCASPQLCI